MKTLAKALDILAVFRSTNSDLGVTEIAQHTGIDKVIVHRMLRTFAEYDFVVQHPTTRRYRLGSAILALAGAYQNSFPPLEAARPHLLKLWEDSSETINFNVPRRHEMVVLQAYESPMRDRVAAEVGQSVPMYCTASGKQWLAQQDESTLRAYMEEVRFVPLTANTVVDPATLTAQLAQIRAQGYATDFAEFDEHIHAISAPIVNQRGEVLACVALLAPAARLTSAQIPKIAPRVVHTAHAISQALAHVEFIN